MIRKILEGFNGKKLSDYDYRYILDMAKSDVIANRVKALPKPKLTSLTQLIHVALQCLIVYKKCA